MVSIFKVAQGSGKWHGQKACLWCYCWACPLLSNAEQNMPPDDQDLLRGKTIFMKYCSACHGPSGQGEGYRLLGTGSS